MFAEILSALRLLARVAKRIADVSSEALHTLYLFSESNIIGVLLPSVRGFTSVFSRYASPNGVSR